MKHLACILPSHERESHSEAMEIFRAHHFSDPEDFLSTFDASSNFDLVIADYDLHRTGKGFCRSLRHRNLSIPIIFLVDKVTHEIATEALALEASALLERPLSPEALASAVERAKARRDLKVLQREKQANYQDAVRTLSKLLTSYETRYVAAEEELWRLHPTGAGSFPLTIPASSN